MKKELKTRKITGLIITLTCIWIAITSLIQAFNCPEMTQTEILFHTLKSFVLNFKYC